MSRFIDLIETFDFSTLTTDTYKEKINGLLERFPKYEKDDIYRTVLPYKSTRTADDYVSIKFCTVGRFPIFGIYTRRDLSLVGVVCQDKIMYALDDFDLHATFVPDLQVRKLCLGIQHSHLASRETPSYTNGFMRSAISTLSLGYSPEKNNEWCEAIVLLTGMTTQAVRFHEMKRHIRDGLGFRGAYPRKTHDGRFQLCNRLLGMQYRWNKISKAIRQGDQFYIYSIYSDFGYYTPTWMTQVLAPEEVALINDKNTKKREIFKRRTKRWNGPLGNSKRKRKEEEARKRIMPRWWTKEDLLEINNKYSERMHGSWYGSVDTYRYDFAFGNCLLRPGQMVRANRFLVPLLGRLQDVLQVQQTLASIYLAVESIQNEGCLLAFFQALQAAHRAIAECKQPVFSFSATAIYLSVKRNKLKVDKIKSHSDFNSVSTSMNDLGFDRFGISKEKIDPEPRQYVPLGCGSITGALGATSVYPLQTRMKVLQSNATYAPYSGVSFFRRSLQHRWDKGSRGFYMIALKIWAKGLLIKK